MVLNNAFLPLVELKSNKHKYAQYLTDTQSGKKCSIGSNTDTEYRIGAYLV